MRDRGRRGSLTKHDAFERLNVATDRNATSRVMRRPHRHGPGAHGPLAPERPLVAFILGTRRVAGDLGRLGRAYDKDMRGRTRQAALALLDNILHLMPATASTTPPRGLTTGRHSSRRRSLTFLASHSVLGEPPSSLSDLIFSCRVRC